MSIVKMKRIRLIALAQERDALLSSLLHVGCVEISEPSDYAADEDQAALLQRDTTDLPRVKGDLNQLSEALQVLNKYAPQKKKLFEARPSVSEKELLDKEILAASLDKAQKVNDHAKAIGMLAARKNRLNAEILALRPWENFDLPLEDRGSARVGILLGTVPSGVNPDALCGAVADAVEESDVRLLSSDREQHYLEVLVHRSQEQTALETLRSFGFSFSQLKDMNGTVADNIRRLEAELKQTEQDQENEIESISAMGQDAAQLQLSIDCVQQLVATESAKERLLTGGAIIYFDGWVEVPRIADLENALKHFDCAYELTDPTPDEIPNVPVKLKNNALTRCMNVVTEMYSLPAYDGTDPNPLMFPFFVLFFGMMMADMGYGILMIAAALVVLKTKPRENTRNFMEGVFWCGVSTLGWGAATGGFFGDFIPQIAKIINPDTTLTALPALFTPLDDTVAIMLGSVVLGCVQIVTGMTVSIINKIKAGDFLDALFDEITWWIILGGTGLAIFGIGTVSGIPVVLTLGILMLVFGGTRKAKGFGKVTSLVGLVYNGVTGFFSDALSYVRLMALMLSGSVIASVFNTLGATFGNVILFIIIAMIGNALNLVLNLLGCYVHDLRLQCLEFFNRFYKEGGKPYKPLAIQTQYVDVIKEEN